MPDFNDHLLERVRERIDPNITDADLEDIVTRLARGEGDVVPGGGKKPGTELVVLYWRDKRLRVVWEPARRSLITILPQFVSQSRGQNVFKLGAVLGWKPKGRR